MVKVFVSGAESFVNYIRKYKVDKITKYALVTFYSLYNNPDAVEFITFLKQHINELMIDSGAFTYMNSLKIDKVEKHYIEKYIKFYHKAKNIADYFISMDVGSIETQKEYHRILTSNGVDAIPVYHLFDNSVDYLNWVCQHPEKKHNLVAIGGYVLEVKRDRVNTRKKLIAIVKYINRKYPGLNIHILGLADTNLISLLKNYIYSVDSTNWLSEIIHNREIKLHKFQNYQQIMYGLNRMNLIQEKFENG